MARPLGIDVSNYQPSVNWSAVKSNGYDFAWTKSTEGVTYEDPSFTSARMTAAKNAGVLIGAYHYARYDNNTAAAEVSHYLSIAGNYIKPGWLPPMLDVEAPIGAGALNSTKAQISAWVNAWCNGILSATGVRPIVYTYISYASTYLDSTVTQWPLWMANYNGQSTQTGGPNATSPWSTWTFWQNNDTTGNASVPGDADVFNGTSTTLQTWVIPAAASSPSPASGATTVGSPTVLNWADVTGATGYDVYVDGTKKATVSSSQWSVSPALANGNHTWHVNVHNNAGTTTGPTWNLTVQPSVVLNAPTNLNVTGTTSSSVSFTWTDTSTNETLYMIERKTGAGGTFTQVASVAGDSTSFSDNATTDPSSPPQPGTTYYYRLRAYGGGSSFGPYSAETSATTFAAAPANLAASQATFFDKVHLAWDAAAGAVGYQLYRGTTSDVNAATALDTSASTNYDDTTAVGGTTYFYWVAGLDTLGRAGAKSAAASGSRAVDNTPPSISGSGFDYTQSTEPVTFTFSEDVHASIDTGDVTITNLTTGDTITPTGWTYDADTNTVSFAMPPLTDGNYRAVLAAAGVADLAGNHPAADGTLDFFVLAGDANHDRTVDLTDFTVLAANFNATGKTWSQGDFNYDGTIDLTDFTILASRFNVTLAPPNPARPLVAPGPATTSLFSADPVREGDLLLPI
jgi:GH25 family lysozyme M1 (1,4-beta-N-acetylmuramidase)